MGHCRHDLASDCPVCASLASCLAHSVLTGTVALKADQMRWIPGQKKFRYDIAGFVSMVRVCILIVLRESVCV